MGSELRVFRSAYFLLAFFDADAYAALPIPRVRCRVRGRPSACWPEVGATFIAQSDDAYIGRG